MKFDIVEIFTSAAKITWKHKVLWIFGILASCGQGSSGNSNSSQRNSGGNSDNPFSPEMMRQAEAFFLRIGNWFEQNMWILYALFAFVFIAIVLQIFFSLVGTAGLVRGVVKVEDGAETLRFGELFGEGIDYFWRLLGSGLVIWLPYMTILILSLLAAFLPLIRGKVDETAMAGGMVVFLLAFCCCAIPFSIALGLYSVQVKRAILVEDLGVFAGLARGWQVFLANIVSVLIVGIILGVFGFIISILLALPVLIFILPLMGSLIQGNITSWQPFIVVGAFLICYSPVAWFFRGILTTYTESVWTLAYLRSTKSQENVPVMIEANA